MADLSGIQHGLNLFGISTTTSTTTSRVLGEGLEVGHIEGLRPALDGKKPLGWSALISEGIGSINNYGGKTWLRVAVTNNDEPSEDNTDWRDLTDVFTSLEAGTPVVGRVENNNHHPADFETLRASYTGDEDFYIAGHFGLTSPYTGVIYNNLDGRIIQQGAEIKGAWLFNNGVWELLTVNSNGDWVVTGYTRATKDQLAKIAEIDSKASQADLTSNVATLTSEIATKANLSETLSVQNVSFASSESTLLGERGTATQQGWVESGSVVRATDPAVGQTVFQITEQNGTGAEIEQEFTDDHKAGLDYGLVYGGTFKGITATPVSAFGGNTYFNFSLNGDGRRDIYFLLEVNGFYAVSYYNGSNGIEITNTTIPVTDYIKVEVHINANPSATSLQDYVSDLYIDGVLRATGIAAFGGTIANRTTNQLQCWTGGQAARIVKFGISHPTESLTKTLSEAHITSNITTIITPSVVGDVTVNLPTTSAGRGIGDSFKIIMRHTGSMTLVGSTFALFNDLRSLTLSNDGQVNLVEIYNTEANGHIYSGKIA